MGKETPIHRNDENGRQMRKQSCLSLAQVHLESVAPSSSSSSSSLSVSIRQSPQPMLIEKRIKRQGRVCILGKHTHTHTHKVISFFLRSLSAASLRSFSAASSRSLRSFSATTLRSFMSASISSLVLLKCIDWCEMDPIKERHESIGSVTAER